MSSLVREFRTFIARGNVVDLAVGVIIGAAFGNVVTSLVSDIIMPPVGWLIGGVQFEGLVLKLNSAGTAYIAYGNFIQKVFNFLLISACIFVVVKAMNRMHGAQEELPKELPKEPSETEKLLMEIRDLLKNKPT